MQSPRDPCSPVHLRAPRRTAARPAPKARDPRRCRTGVPSGHSRFVMPNTTADLPGGPNSVFNSASPSVHQLKLTSDTQHRARNGLRSLLLKHGPSPDARAVRRLMRSRALVRAPITFASLSHSANQRTRLPSWESTLSQSGPRGQYSLGIGECSIPSASLPRTLRGQRRVPLT